MQDIFDQIAPDSVDARPRDIFDEIAPDAPAQPSAPDFNPPVMGMEQPAIGGMPTARPRSQWDSRMIAASRQRGDFYAPTPAGEAFPTTGGYSPNPNRPMLGPEAPPVAPPVNPYQQIEDGLRNPRGGLALPPETVARNEARSPRAAIREELLQQELRRNYGPGWDAVKRQIDIQNGTVAPPTPYAGPGSGAAAVANDARNAYSNAAAGFTRNVGGFVRSASQFLDLGDEANDLGEGMIEAGQKGQEDNPLKTPLGKQVSGAIGFLPMAMTGPGAIPLMSATTAGGMYADARQLGDDPDTAAAKSLVSGLTAALTSKLIFLPPSERAGVAGMLGSSYVNAAGGMGSQAVIDEAVRKYGTGVATAFEEALSEIPGAALIVPAMHGGQIRKGLKQQPRQNFQPQANVDALYYANLPQPRDNSIPQFPPGREPQRPIVPAEQPSGWRPQMPGAEQTRPQEQPAQQRNQGLSMDQARANAQAASDRIDAEYDAERKQAKIDDAAELSQKLEGLTPYSPEWMRAVRSHKPKWMRDMEQPNPVEPTRPQEQPAPRERIPALPEQVDQQQYDPGELAGAMRDVNEKNAAADDLSPIGLPDGVADSEKSTWRKAVAEAPDTIEQNRIIRAITTRPDSSPKELDDALAIIRAIDRPFVSHSADDIARHKNATPETRKAASDLYDHVTTQGGDYDYRRKPNGNRQIPPDVQATRPGESRPGVAADTPGLETQPQGGVEGGVEKLAGGAGGGEVTDAQLRKMGFDDEQIAGMDINARAGALEYYGWKLTGTDAPAPVDPVESARSKLVGKRFVVHTYDKGRKFGEVTEVSKHRSEDQLVVKVRFADGSEYQTTTHSLDSDIADFAKRKGVTEDELNRAFAPPPDLAKQPAPQPASQPRQESPRTTEEELAASLADVSNTKGKRYADKMQKESSRLLAKNPDEIHEYRDAGYVTRSGDGKYTLHLVADTESKSWRIAHTVDVTDQYAKGRGQSPEGPGPASPEQPRQQEPLKVETLQGEQGIVRMAEDPNSVPASMGLKYNKKQGGYVVPAKRKAEVEAAVTQSESAPKSEMAVPQPPAGGQERATVKDYDGNDLVVYRGRPDGLPEHGGPYFFSEDRGVAAMWSGEETSPLKHKPGKVISANISFANPLKTSDISYVQELQRGGAGRDRIMADMKARGHDGLIYYDKEGDKPTYVAFDESQIKKISVDSNKVPTGYSPKPPAAETAKPAAEPPRPAEPPKPAAEPAAEPAKSAAEPPKGALDRLEASMREKIASLRKAKTAALDKARREGKRPGGGTGDVSGMYAGERGASSSRQRIDARRTADEMTKAGKDSETIRLATGWFKNPHDGKWRYEIDDSGMRLKHHPLDWADLRAEGDSRPMTLGEVIDHPKLFEAYPDLANMRVAVVDSGAEFQGAYSRSQNKIRLDARLRESNPDFRRTLLHEIQHAVQDIEGFGRGATGNDPNYRNTSGEIEARDVSARADMNPDERSGVRPLSSEKIAAKDVVVNESAAVAASATENAPSHAFAQPKTMAGTGDTKVTSREIMAQVEKVTGTPFRVGHGNFGQKKAVGWLRRSTDVARLQTAEALDVAYHEAGHAIHDKVIGWNTPWPAGTATELQTMGRQLYGNRKPNGGYRREGLAEFVARDLLGDAAGLAKDAPKTIAWWNADVLGKHPEFAKEYAKLKEMAKAWDDQGAVARIAGKINQLDRGPRALLKTAWEKLSRIMSPYAWTNDGSPLEKAQNRVIRDRNVDEKNLPIVMNPAKMRQALKMTAPGTARGFIEDAAVNNRYEKVGPSLKEALTPVKDDLDSFVNYAYARRAQDLHGRGIDPGITLADANHAVKQLETPERKAAVDAVTKWAGHLMDYVVEAGGLSKEAADAVRAANPVYLPLKRFFDENQLGGGAGGKKGIVNQGGAVQRIKGSGRSIIDPLESLALQAEHMITLGNKARVARAIVDLAEVAGKSGWFAEKVDLESKGQQFTVEDVKKQLEALGADLSQVNLDDVMTVFTQPTRYTGKDNIVTVWRNGKREFWELAPDVYKTVTEMDKDHVPAFLRFLSAPARIVRLGATALRPAFQVANMIRDAATASVLGKGFRTPLASVRGMLADWAGKPEAERWRAAGGSMTTMMGQDRINARRTIDESLASGFKEKAIIAAKHPVDAVRSLLEFGEAGPRITEFKRALAEAEAKWGKGSESAVAEALLASKEITVDFTRQGMIGAIANQFIPFFNARIQGTSRLYRALTSKETALPVMGRALAWVAAPSLALWMMNKDEEWYRELPDYERMNNWHFSLDGKSIYKVPVTESIGKLFGTSPVAAIDGAYQKDPARVSEGVFELAKSFLPIGSPMELVSAYLKPTMEVATNHDSFRGRPIVPQYMADRKMPKDQYQKWTTESAKMVGRWLNVSPMKIEHLISGYTGGLGLDLAKWGETMAGVRESRPSEAPITSRFTAKDPVGRGESMERFYERLRDLRQKKGSKSLKPQEIAELGQLESKSRAISAIRDRIDEKQLSEEQGLRQIQNLVTQKAK